MKKNLVILMSLIILGSGCGDKSASEEKSIQQEGMAVQSEKKQPVRHKEKEISKEDTTVSETKRWGDSPDFTLPAIDGTDLTLSKFVGKVIILDFWATWCPPCRMEIPDFIELYNEYRDKGLVIIGLSLDQGNQDKVKRFKEKMGINYPIVMGNREVVEDFGGIRGIPTTFIIDKRGNISKKIVGFRPKQVFEDEIKPLLEGSY